MSTYDIYILFTTNVERSVRSVKCESTYDIYILITTNVEGSQMPIYI